MQYFAVGIEQILSDQELYSCSMFNKFKEIEYQLYQVLCDLQYAIHMLNIQQKPNVSRSVMPDKDRNIKQLSQRSLRDFAVLRDYINVNHFIANLIAYHKNNFNEYESRD
jgi:hypothetical protein